MCITINAIPDDKTATAFSFLAIPNATANAKIKGKFPKIAVPTWDIIVNKPFNTVPDPNNPVKLYVSIVVWFVNEEPNPNKSPAIGKTDTGKKKDFPTCWIVAKNFPDSLDLFIFHFPPNKTDTLSLK